MNFLFQGNCLKKKDIIYLVENIDLEKLNELTKNDLSSIDHEYTKKIIEDSYKKFKFKNDTKEIEAFSYIFDNCNYYFNLYLIILISSDFSNKEKVILIEKLFNHTIIQYRFPIFLNILKDFVENFGSSYKNGTFPFLDKDKFIKITGISIKKKIPTQNGGFQSSDNMKSNNSKMDKNSIYILEFLSVIFNIILIFFKIVDPEKEDVDLLDWIFFTIWAFFKKFSLIPKLPFNLGVTYFFTMLELGKPVFESTATTSLQLGCDSLNLLIISALSALGGPFAAIVNPVISMVGLLPNLICNKLVVYLPRTLALAPNFFQALYYFSNKNWTLFFQNTISFIPNGSELMDICNSWFLNLKLGLDTVNKNGQKMLLTMDSFAMLVKLLNDDFDSLKKNNNSFKKTFDTVFESSIEELEKSSDKQKEFINKMNNFFDYLPPVSNENEIYELMVGLNSLLQIIAETSNKNLPIIMKTYNEFNRYLQKIINNFIIHLIINSFFKIMTFIKSYSYELYDKMGSLIKLNYALNNYKYRWGTNFPSVSNSNSSNNNKNSLKSLEQMSENAEKQFLDSLNIILNNLKFTCDKPKLIFEEITSFSRDLLIRYASGSYLDTNLFSNSLSTFAETSKLFSCPVNKNRDDIHCKIPGILDITCSSLNQFEKLVNNLSNTKDSQKILSRSFLITMLNSNTFFDLPLIKVEFPSLKKDLNKFEQYTEVFKNPELKELFESFEKLLASHDKKNINNIYLELNHFLKEKGFPVEYIDFLIEYFKIFQEYKKIVTGYIEIPRKYYNNFSEKFDDFSLKFVKFREKWGNQIMNSKIFELFPTFLKEFRKKGDNYFEKLSIPGSSKNPFHMISNTKKKGGAKKNKFLKKKISKSKNRKLKTI